MITIVDYGDACINQVAVSIKKLTKDYRLTKYEAEICASDKIILAGCGNIVSVMKKIQLLNLYSVLRVIKKPMLGIGLGMQLMADYSTEGNFPCLGLFPGTAVKFSESLTENNILGMHRVDICKQSGLFSGIKDKTEFYFNNSYYLPKSELSTSTCSRGIAFCASLEKDSFYGVQFHPEMSGDAGLKILQNFVEM